MTTSRLPMTLDWIVHQPTRLSIIALLGHSPHSHMKIASELGINKGLVSKHAHYLELIGYISRTIEATTGQIHRSIYALTPDGERALQSYYSTVTQILESAPSGYR